MISPSLISAALWVVASTVTACLPMRRQFWPGVCLLVLAPVLIIWLAYDRGWIVAGVAGLAFVSMFRHPLRYLVRRVTG